MPWRNGGVIGKRNLPSISEASGVWRLGEIEAASRDAAWPVSSLPSPNEVAGLMLWLDGADGATLYDSTSGGSLVAADGTVARWEDKSGNARHFTQGTSGVRPTRRLGVKNGLAAVEFANDWLTGTYTYAVGSVFCVWNHPTTAAGDNFPSIMSQRTSSALKTANGVMNYNLGVPSATVARVSLDPNPGSGSYRLNAVVTAAGYLSFGNGALVRTSPDRWQHNSSTFVPASGSQAFALGGDTFAATTRLMQNGHIGEVIAYSGTLTVAQVLSVEGYLVRKWGLA